MASVYKNSPRLMFFCMLLLGLFSCQILAEEPVGFLDENLKAAIEESLWLDDPTPSDMLELNELICVNQGIADITGLEYATNLDVLNLRYNHIGDVSSLSRCTQLRVLNLSENKIISDLSPIAMLTGLEDLDCHANQITDLSFTAHLHNLTRLVLRTNGVTDVSELAHLTSLTNLRLEWNEIEDISPLVGMTQLKQLNIKDNHITDISALADMVELEHLTFRGNPVEDISALAGLFRLSYLSIRDCKIRNVTPLCSMERLDKLYLERNPLDIQAYKNDLFTIVENNPGLSLSYSPNSRASAEVTAILDGSLGGIRLQWSEVPNGPGYTSYYQIARSSGTSSERIPISDWQTETTFVDDTIVMGEDYSYWVQCSVSSTGDQSGDYSSPISGQVIPHLTIASSPGGTVNIPGEGSFTYDESTWVSIVASPVDPCLFTFVGWSGRAVDERKVEDPHAVSTRVFADGLYDLHANFVSTQSTLYVDANVPASLEYGTLANPFLGIQDAVEVSMAEGTIYVAPGTYEENVYVETESLTLLGYDPNGTEPVSLPIIDGNDLGPCLTLNSNSVARGFVLTGGESTFSCRGHDVTLSHCLLVGNQSTDPNAGVIDIADSNAVLIHCTVSDNLGTSISLHTSTLSLYNSIVWGVDLESVSLDESSDLYLDHTASSFVWAGTSVFQAEPLFATTGLWQELDDDQWLWQPGDYHLQSVFGRWNPESAQWETDVQTSPYVGAGDRVIWQEQGWSPGENALNCGVYGGTPMASQEQE